MVGREVLAKDKPISVLGIDIWSSKGIQKVLDRIKKSDLDFEVQISSLRDILQYPGLWDIGNTSRFLDVFLPIVKKHAGNSEQRLTLMVTWEKFVDLKKEQEIGDTTISVEDQVESLLHSSEYYASGFAGGMKGVGAYSIGK